MKQPTGTIKQSVTIKNATPDQVYEAFINAKIHSKFTGSKATCVPKAGGKITAWDGYITGKNIKLTKGKLIVQEWYTTEFPKGSEPSILKISLKKKGKDTILSMLQKKVPKSQVKEYTEGWKEHYWDMLNKYFEE